jgi:predicted ATPase/transcriptional regulator with XRE-family HTH domain
MSEALSELVRRHRRSVGMSQAELAGRSGISERAIRDLERGSSRPRQHSVRAIAGALRLAGPDLVVFLSAGRSGGGIAPVPAPVPALGAGAGLVGRRRELEALVDLVRGGRHRQITITGPGGIGKSRLATALVAALETGTDLDVRGIDVSAVHDPTLLVEVAAEAILGPGPSGSRLPTVERVAAELRGRRLVLLLDCCDRVVAAAPDLALLVRRCPGLTLVVTSQRPLRVTGERLVRLAPLPPPEAVELFALRAAEANPAFELTLDNAAAVTSVCVRVGGLPLAVELAAARMRILTPAELVERLGRQLPVLTDGAADLPARHRSLRATIESSLDLVDPPARAMFDWLGAFPAGGVLDDVEAVATVLGAGAGSVLGMLGQLVDTGLVRTTTEAGRSRYTLPDPMSELAAERLAARDDRGRVDAAVAGRLLVRLSRWSGQPAPTDSIVVGRDADNLRAALAWAVVHRPGDIDIHALYRYFQLSGRYVEGEAILVRVAAAGQVLGRVRAGQLALLRGDLAGAERLGTAALAGLDPADHAGRVLTHLLLGTAASERRDAGTARRHLRTALRHARPAGDDQLTATVLNNLGVLSATMGNLRAADRQWTAALVVKRRAGMGAITIGTTLNNLAELARERGQAALAAGRADEAASVFASVGFHRAAAQAQSTRALALLADDAPAAATAAIDRAEALLAGTSDAGDDERTALVIRLRRSVVLHAAGRFTEASEIMGRTMPVALRADHRTREEAAFTLGAHATRLVHRDPVAAAGLAAACTALFTQANRPVPNNLAGVLDEATAACRAATPPAVYARAEADGASLSTVALVRLAAAIGADRRHQVR